MEKMGTPFGDDHHILNPDITAGMREHSIQSKQPKKGPKAYDNPINASIAPAGRTAPGKVKEHVQSESNSRFQSGSHRFSLMQENQQTEQRLKDAASNLTNIDQNKASLVKVLTDPMTSRGMKQKALTQIVRNQTLDSFQKESLLKETIVKQATDELYRIVQDKGITNNDQKLVLIAGLRVDFEQKLTRASGTGTLQEAMEGHPAIKASFEAFLKVFNQQEAALNK
jgi:hypothetical protein